MIGTCGLSPNSLRIKPRESQGRKEGLWKAMRFFDKTESVLVTFGQEDEFEHDGFRIRVMPFHKLSTN